MRRVALAVLLLAGACAAPPPPKSLTPEISAELALAGERKAPTRPESLERALLPPVQMGMPNVPTSILRLIPLGTPSA